MILTETEIRKIVLENPGQALIAKGREYSEKLRRHIYGAGLDSYFKQIDSFERPTLLNLRKQYSKSNKDLFSRLGRPLDKVFSARGGSVYFNLGEQAEARARIFSQDVRNGMSIRRYVEHYWKPHLLDDPFGVLLMEIAPRPEAVRLKNEGKPFVYPTYRSIREIYDYLPKGNRLEYLVLEVGDSEKERVGVQKEKLFRVIDDSADYYVKKTSTGAEILTGETLPNFFTQVPAMLNSDIPDPDHRHAVLSLYDDVIELAEHFLLKGSIRVAHDFMHGFPKYAEFADSCPACKGYGTYEGKKCEDCGGSGMKMSLRVSDVKALAWPTKEDQVILPAQVGAYVSPDRNFHEIATADLADLENAMCVTLWGTQSRLKTQGTSISPTGDARTATEVMDDLKPQADRLVPVSEMAEARHKFILDSIIRVQLLPGYKGCSVNYGRRYLLESPDAIWLKYSDARTKGAPQNVLDTLLNEYFDANYQSDPMGLAVAKKLMYVEPFVHMTAAQLKALTPDPADYKAKLYFSEWLATVSEGAILAMSVDELKALLAEYANKKTIPEAQPVAA